MNRPGSLGSTLIRWTMALLLASTAAVGAEPSVEVVRAGLIANFPPFSQVAPDGKPVGFAVDLFEAVARAEGFRVDWRSGNSEQLWQDLRQGRLDVLPPVARRPEREGLAEFTTAHTLGYESFFVPRGKRTFETVDEARGRALIATRGSAGWNELASRGFGSELTLVDSMPEGFRLLAAGGHEAMLAPVRQGIAILAETGMVSAVEPGPPLHEFRVEFAMAVRKGDLALHDRVERGLATVKASGEYDRLYTRWLRPHDPATLPLQQTLWIAAASLLAFALLAGWAWSLHRQVQLRHLAELKLAKERNLLRQVIDSDPNLILVKNAADRYTLANLSGAALYGVSPRGIVGKSDAELLRGGGESLEAKIIEHALAGQAELQFDDPETLDQPVALQVADISLTDVTGRQRWFSAARMPLPGTQSAFAAVLLVATDITARRQFQDELRASEAKFRALVEQSLAGIFIQQGDRIRYANNHLASMLGYAGPAALIDQFSVTDLVAPEDRTQIANFMDATRRGEVTERHLEVSAVRSDGSLTRIEAHARVLEIEGRPATIGIAIDISERERAAQARERALATAEDLARLKTEFMSNMSHELRTPLNQVIGMAMVGQRASDPAKANQAFGRILDAGARLDRLLADLLDFSTVETRNFVVEPVPIELAIAIGPALLEGRELATAKGLSFRDERAPDLPPYLVADPRRLHQILSHLLSNAVKFTERGEVAVRLARDGAWLTWEIADTGIGIAPEHLSQLFHPFEQGDGSRTRRYGGTGLGLALIQLVVRRLGGTLSVESEPGRGTRVRVRLPIVESTPAEVAATAQAQLPVP